MDMDLAGLVTKIRLAPNSRNSLLPLFEALVNSIHAIDAAKEKQGLIEIVVLRDGFQGVLTISGGKKVDDLHVAGFEVIDNGIGFDEENFRAFSVADTPFKQNIGGQGIGRLMWLKTFSDVHVESVFGAPEKQVRTFDFHLKANGITNVKVLPAGPAPRRTRVKLTGMLPEYKEVCPRRLSVLALHIVDHCVEFLAMPKAPKILLRDPLGNEQIDLNNLFNKDLKLSSDTTKFRLKGKDFKMNHILMRKTHDATHQLNICAHDRPARSEPLGDYISNLPKTLTDETSGKPMVYTGYLSSKYLNDCVVGERTDFHKASAEGGPGGFRGPRGTATSGASKRARMERRGSGSGRLSRRPP
jgi:hypothetical protein